MGATKSKDDGKIGKEEGSLEMLSYKRILIVHCILHSGNQ